MYSVVVVSPSICIVDYLVNLSAVETRASCCQA